MNESNQKKIAAMIHEAVMRGDSSEIETCVQQFASFCFREAQSDIDTFPSPIFNVILKLMAEQKFLDMDGSHNLLLVFEYDWARLDKEQKVHLLEAIRQSYDQFKDWMSYFVLSELLGEYYCNEASFRVLCELQSTVNETARALVPHGFEHIVRGAQSTELREKAMAHLVSMKNDHSPQVRAEVTEALTNILR